MPLISVILPVNRDDGFLDEAVNSIVNQTYKDFELLIIANGCSDVLWKKVESWKIRDTRIKIHRLPFAGLAFAPNYGISVALGDYISRMDSDDIALSNKLEKQINFLLAHPEIDVLGSYSIDFTENPEEGIKFRDVYKYPINHKDFALYIPWKSAFSQPTTIIKKDTLIQNGGYKFGFFGEDNELWIRLYEAGAIFHNLPEVLLNRRLHNKQLTKQTYDNNVSAEVIAYLMMYYIKTGKLKFLLRAISHLKSFYWIKKIIKKVANIK